MTEKQQNKYYVFKDIAVFLTPLIVSLFGFIWTDQVYQFRKTNEILFQQLRSQEQKEDKDFSCVSQGLARCCGEKAPTC